MSGNSTQDQGSEELQPSSSTTAGGDGAPSQADQQDGGPGSHTQGGSGGAENDVASGGVPEAAEDE